MKITRFGSLGLFGAGLLAMCSGYAVAGGLVDTSADAFDAATFASPGSADFTNPWWTLTDHDNYLYYAEGEDECEWNLVEVLDTYTHNFDAPYTGVDTRIILDRVWVDEECASEPTEAGFLDFMDVNPEPEAEESTYDWLAQDTEENLWYMGEDTIDGDGSKEGSFVAGCNGAEAGIVVQGDPGKGDFYQQEFLEDEAEDWGKVLNFILADDEVCMKTKEWTPLESGHVEHKFYCSDGNYGELAMVEELKGKTVIVELVATDVNVESLDEFESEDIDSTPSCPPPLP